MSLKRTIRKSVGKVKSCLQTAGQVKRVLANQNGPLKLHIGSGRNYKEGWVNIDIDPRAQKDILYNAAKKIPFPDNSVDFIYTEHFIEHLTYEDGFSFMKEALRVLKPGGALRTACPDLDFMINGYVNDTWREQEWVKLIKAEWYPSRCYALNQNMREDGGHLYIYNEEDLIRRLVEAGFPREKVRAEKMNQSSHKELQNIERRADSLIVDAQKQA